MNQIQTLKGNQRTIEWANDVLCHEGKPMGTLSTGVDITEKVNAYSQVEKSKEKFRKLVEASPNGVLQFELSDGRLKFIDSNPACNRLLGLNPSKLTGKLAEDVLSPLGGDVVERIYADVVAGEKSIHLKEVPYNIRGVTGVYDVHASKISKEHVSVIINDITALVEARQELKNHAHILEQEVSERTKDLISERKNLEKVLDSKIKFIDQISHDIRNPLTPLINLLPLLRDQMKTKKQKEQLEMLIRNAMYLKHLSVETLELGRLDTGRVRINREEIDIKLFMKHFILDIQQNLQAKDIKPILTLPRRKTVVSTDPMKLKEVLHNIVSNSIKFSSKECRIWFAVSVTGESLVISVKDEGTGIPKNSLAHVFDEFFQADHSRPAGSIGLGLTISKKITDMLGVGIRVESEGLGKGTTVVLTLPMG